jgi:endo-1,4-beta-xylanase
VVTVILGFAGCDSAGTEPVDTGSSATGGSGITSNCTEAEKTLTSNGTGQHCGYTYEYWKDQGTGSLVLKSDGFSVNWSNINNLLGRKGTRPGSANLVATYEANYQPNGNSYLCVYGWTRNPLVEYYIVDSWGGGRPPGGASVGTVTSDGGTYDIYRTQRVNQPSIDGTQTFDQYWSVRTSPRTGGTITVGNHFSAWASNGLNMGSFYEVSMTVEGYQSSGTADVKMSIE